MIPHSAGDDDAPQLGLRLENHQAERLERREDGRADLLPYPAAYALAVIVLAVIGVVGLEGRAFGAGDGLRDQRTARLARAVAAMLY